jgi:hypothetical protein
MIVFAPLPMFCEIISLVSVAKREVKQAHACVPLFRVVSAVNSHIKTELRAKSALNVHLHISGLLIIPGSVNLSGTLASGFSRLYSSDRNINLRDNGVL